MMDALLKLASATAMSPVLPFGGSTNEQPEITTAVENLWLTMDPVIGISATGNRVHSNLCGTW